MGQVRHLCRCEPNADGCILFDVQRSRSQKAHSFQYGDRNIHQRCCENHRYMPLLLCTSREQEIDESFVFCGKRKWKCPTILQNHHGTRTNQAACARIDYLPPKARLLTSTCDQPSKTRMHRPNIHCTKEKNLTRWSHLRWTIPALHNHNEPRYQKIPN